MVTAAWESGKTVQVSSLAAMLASASSAVAQGGAEHQLEPRRAALAEELVVGAGLGRPRRQRDRHERERGQGHRLPGREGVARGHHGVHRLVPQQQVLDPASGRGGTHQRDVELALLDRPGVLPAPALANGDLDARVLRAEGHEGALQAPAHAVGGTEAELAPLAEHEVVGEGAGRVHLGEHAPGLDQEDVARAGQAHRPARALHEGKTHLPLQARQLLADRRLRDVQPLRGAPEVQLLREGDEVPQLTQLHPSPRCPDPTGDDDERS